MGAFDFAVGPLNQIGNAVGIGNLSDRLGLNEFINFMSGQTGFDESVRQYNTSLEWEKEKFAKEIELANTAHQREMEDLKAAGLNPIMFGNRGAETPSVGGVSPMNMNNAGQGLRDLVFSSIGTALDLQRQQKENELIGQQIKNLKTENGYRQFRQMVEEMEEMDWEMPDGKTVNKAQMTMAFLYNSLIQQEQEITQREYDLGFTEKYGNWREVMNLINKGTGSFKDIATGIADLLSMGRRPTIPMNTETTTTDAYGTIKKHTYQRRY